MEIKKIDIDSISLEELEGLEDIPRWETCKDILTSTKIDKYSKVYLYMAILSYKYGGAYHSDNITSVNLKQYHLFFQSDIVYFDYEGGRPFIDFHYTKNPKNTFWKFFITKIIFHFVLEKTVKISSQFFLESLVSFAYPIFYRTATIGSQAIGTIVSEKVMSLSSELFHECCKCNLIDQRGFWLTDLDRNHLVDSSLCKSIIEILHIHKIKSVYDFGCGNGYYTSKINEAGISCHGFDGNPKTLTSNCSVLDLTEKLLLPTVDCLISLEVGEHIPVEYESIFLDNITKSCSKLLIISWAIEGQGGVGHFNCRNNDYIIKQIESRGFTLSPEDTDLVKLNIIHQYFHNTLMVFRKNPV